MTGIRLSNAQKKVVSTWELRGYEPISFKKEGVDRGDITVEFKKAQRNMTPLPKEFAENGIGETYHWHEFYMRVSKLGTEHIAKYRNYEHTIYPHCEYPNIEASANYRAIIDSNASRVSSQLVDNLDINSTTSSTMSSTDTISPRLAGDKKMSKRVQLNLRLDGYSQLLDTVKEKAKEQNKSITQFVVDALKVACDIEPDPMPSQLSSQLPSNLVTKEEFEKHIKPLYTKLGSLNWEIYTLKDEIKHLKLKDSTLVPNDNNESLPILEALDSNTRGQILEMWEDIDLNSLNDRQSDSPGVEDLPAPESDRQSDSPGVEDLPALESDHQSDSPSELPAPESEILRGVDVMEELGIARPDTLTRMSAEKLASKGFERIKVGNKSKYKRLLSSHDTRQLANV